MQKTPRRSGVIGALALALLVTAQQFVSLAPALAQLQGGVTTENMLPEQDPFGAQSPPEEGPPPGWQRGQAQAAQPPPEPPRKPFGLSLEDNSMPEEPQQPPPPQQPLQPPMQPQMGQAPPPQDPDNTPEMQLLWDAWHKRVAGEIFTRFNLFAKAAFRFSPPLVAVVTYRVSRDGRVDNVQLARTSKNLFFNLLITQVVKSMNGNTALLQYPPGSRRQVVEKVGTFSQNVGRAGFSHQTGDSERIVGR